MKSFSVGVALIVAGLACACQAPPPELRLEVVRFRGEASVNGKSVRGRGVVELRDPAFVEAPGADAYLTLQLGNGIAVKLVDGKLNLRNSIDRMDLGLLAGKLYVRSGPRSTWKQLRVHTKSGSADLLSREARFLVQVGDGKATFSVNDGRLKVTEGRLAKEKPPSKALLLRRGQVLETMNGKRFVGPYFSARTAYLMGSNFDDLERSLR